MTDDGWRLDRHRRARRHPAPRRALRGDAARQASPCSAPRDDQVFAIDDHCPHKGGPLSQGIVHGAAVTCPLHNWVISLETGKALGADEGSVRTIPVRLEEGRILIALDRQLSRAA